MRVLVRHQDEGGAVAVVTGLVVLALVGLMAFVADLGMAYASKRDLQNAADAAALAVAQQVVRDSGPGANCAEMRDRVNLSPTRQTYSTLANTIFASNTPNPDAGLAGGAVSADCTSRGLVLSAEGRQLSRTAFAGIFGVDGIQLSQSAKTLVASGLPYGLRPFGVCEQDASFMWTKTPTGQYPPRTVVYNDPKPKEPVRDCSAGVGNWGILDLDSGGGGRGGGPSQCEGTKGWIECGFNGTLPNPSTIPGQTGGFGGSVDSQLLTLDGKEFAIPVFSTASGNGSNSQYGVTKFIVVKMCGFDMGTKSPDATAQEMPASACYDDVEWQAAKVSAASEFGVDGNLSFIQLVYVTTVTAGQLNVGCSLDDPCSTGARVVKLIE